MTAPTPVGAPVLDGVPPARRRSRARSWSSRTRIRRHDQQLVFVYLKTATAVINLADLKSTFGCYQPATSFKFSKMPKSRKSRAPAPPKRKASDSLNEFDLSESDPESPFADADTANATAADAASKASSTNHDWDDEDLSEASDADRSSPAILEDIAGSGVTYSAGDGKEYLAREGAPAPPSFNGADQSASPLPLDQREDMTANAAGAPLGSQPAGDDDDCMIIDSPKSPRREVSPAAASRAAVASSEQSASAAEFTNTVNSLAPRVASSPANDQQNKTPRASSPVGEGALAKKNSKLSTPKGGLSAASADMYTQRIVNSSVHSAIGTSPSRLIFGDHVDIDRCILTQPAIPLHDKLVVDYVQQLSDMQFAMMDAANNHQLAVQEKVVAKAASLIKTKRCASCKLVIWC
jgi:hypothetical protein